MLTIFLALSCVSSKDIKDINFNVSSELTQQNDTTGLVFRDNVTDVTLRILDEESRGESIDSMKRGFTKYNDTVYVFDTRNNNLELTHMYSLGEYIKINGTMYWVEVSSDDIAPSTFFCSKYLDDFNSNNVFESVPVT